MHQKNWRNFEKEDKYNNNEHKTNWREEGRYSRASEFK